MALRPAVELSYLRKEEQADLAQLIQEMECTPSHAQALKLRRLSEGKAPGERLARDAIVSIMQEDCESLGTVPQAPAGQGTVKRKGTAKGEVRPKPGNGVSGCSPSPHLTPSTTKTSCYNKFVPKVW